MNISLQNVVAKAPLKKTEKADNKMIAPKAQVAFKAQHAQAHDTFVKSCKH